MSRIVAASLGTAVWRAGLADPHLHWKRRRSAWELAVAWEAARQSAAGLPPDVEAVLGNSDAFADPMLLIGIVEHRVQLDTKKTPSQNDLWCVLRTRTGLASVAVEGKAGEDFDKPLTEWMGAATDRTAKEARLAFLCGVLGSPGPPDHSLRYQLFHRSASAVLEAERWGLGRALMLVHSFSESKTSWLDYAAFATWLGVAAERNRVVGPIKARGSQLFLGWVDSPCASDAVAALAV